MLTRRDARISVVRAGSHEILEVSVGCTALCAWSFELTRPTHAQLVLTAELSGAIGSDASTQQHL